MCNHMSLNQDANTEVGFNGHQDAVLLEDEADFS